MSNQMRANVKTRTQTDPHIANDETCNQRLYGIAYADMDLHIADDETLTRNSLNQTHLGSMLTASSTYTVALPPRGPLRKPS